MWLLRFLRKHLAPFWIVIGGALAGYGYLSEGLELYRLGLPVWAWQLVGVVLVIAGLLVFVGRNEPHHAAESAAAPRDAAPPENPKRVGFTNALKEIHNAIQWSSYVGRHSSHSDLGEFRAILESAFATCRKHFDLPTPMLEDASRTTLDHGVAYLRTIQPFLRAQHFDEAREAARKFTS